MDFTDGETIVLDRSTRNFVSEFHRRRLTQIRLRAKSNRNWGLNFSSLFSSYVHWNVLNSGVLFRVQHIYNKLVSTTTTCWSVSVYVDGSDKLFYYFLHIENRCKREMNFAFKSFAFSQVFLQIVGTIFSYTRAFKDADGITVICLRVMTDYFTCQREPYVKQSTTIGTFKYVKTYTR